MCGLIDTSHVELRNDRVYLDPSFATALTARGISTANLIVTSTNSSIDACWNALADKPFTKWLPHGHIGDDAMWTAVAKLALAEGVPAEITNDIARGHKKDRERFKANWLSKTALSKSTPLASLIDWLHT
jgi:hypothetical protein